MKPLSLAILLLAFATISAHAAVTDTTRRDTVINATIESPASYPGGVNGFYRFIQKKLKYPPVAQLIGINGKLSVSFIVDRDGYIREATPLNCIGAGCEAEAVDVLKASPRWSPGIYKGKPVRVMYTVPISFKIGDGDDKVTMKQLRNSDYGFIFQIQGQVYTIDQAETMLGKNFRSGQIEEAALYDASGQYAVKGKKETYILVMRGN